MKGLYTFVSLTLVTLGLLDKTSAAPAPAASIGSRALPEPVDVTTAKTYLASLTIQPEANADTYDRKLFPHWITIAGKCDTREEVLMRDGTNVVTNAACSATSGSWYSEYDKHTWDTADKIQIDHLVPLSEAWKSGASEWTTAHRQLFANDLARPQLIAVTGSVNESKGDADPAHWMPPNTDYHCTYVRAWITVKHYYQLAVDQDEHDKLSEVLDTC